MAHSKPVSRLFNFSGLSSLNFAYFGDLDCTPGAHFPVMMKFGCWDARMGGQMHTLQPGKILFHRSAGASLPVDLHGDINLEGCLALSDLKDIEQIVIAPHSDCLAAKTALMYPDLSDIPEGHEQFYNLNVIHKSLRAVGADLRAIAQLCWKDAHGDESVATNLMAKRLAVVSLQNLLGYKIWNNGKTTIAEAVERGEIEVAVIYVDLQAGGFELLNPDTGIFHPLDQQVTLRPVAVCDCGDAEAATQPAARLG